MKQSFFVNASNIVLVQELVKKHRLYFVSNPIRVGREYQVCISGDVDRVEAFNKDFDLEKAGL